MRISKEGLDLIKKFEGWRNAPYLDSANVPTIGYGFTYYPNSKKVSLQDSPITLREGERLLRELIQPYEDAVNRLVDSNLNQNQFDALVSFTYNLGEGNLSSSTLLKKVNLNPNDKTIAQEFEKWVYAGGKVLNGLKRRRKSEAYHYFK